MNTQGYAIAIDGPVAAGKGTIASLLARKLHGFHLNTGAMYRCLALSCLENNIPVEKKEQVLSVLGKIWFDLTPTEVFLNDTNVTERIKQRDVAQAVPKVAAIAEVRREMVQRQREIGLKKISLGQVVLTEGRDAATKIFPDAKLKIFLTARAEIRAKRRFEQMGGKANSTISFDEILSDTKDRDYKDIHRIADPLVSDPKSYGYFVLDDSDLNEEQTVEKVLEQLKRT